MQNDVQAILQLLELTRLKIANLQTGGLENEREADLVKDAEMALGWATSKLSRLAEAIRDRNPK